MPACRYALPAEVGEYQAKVRALEEELGYLMPVEREEKRDNAG